MVQATHSAMLHGKPIHKMHSVWFEDGNVILLTATDKREVAHYHAARVHRSVLTHLSPILKAKVDALADVKHKEMFEGALVVSLDDNVYDVEEFLQYIYGQRLLPFEHLAPYQITLQAVESICRIAHKYGLSALRRQIICILQRDWPADLAAWDANEAIIEERLDELAEDGSCDGYDECGPEPCSVIRLARDCDAPELLPAAFYHLNRVFFRIHVHGVKDGANDDLVDSTSLSFDEIDYPLTLKDKDSLLYGRESLRMSVTTWLYGELRDSCGRDPKTRCKTRVKESERSCGVRARDWWRDAAVETLLNGTAVLDPLSSLAKLRAKIQAQPSVCRQCKTKIVKMINEKRSEIWEELPHLFELGPKVSNLRVERGASEEV